MNVSENSTKLGHTQISFTRVVGHITKNSGLRENFTDSTALSVSGYAQWLNINGAGEANMTMPLEINKTAINKRWNFTLTAQGIDEINNNTFRNPRLYGNYTVFMGRLGWDIINYTVNPANVPEWHYNMDTKVSIYSYRLFDWNTTPMLVLNYTVVESNGGGGDIVLPPIAQFSVNLTPGPAGMLAQFFSQSNNTIPGTTKYAWNFTNGGTKEDSSLENPTFTYTTAGTYSVNLTITHPGGISDSELKTNYIIIYTPTPTPTPTPCPPVTECCDDYTTSLLHYTGAELDVDIIDENTQNSWLLWGVGWITTDTSKFGGSSLNLSEAGAHARSAYSATSFNLGKGNWTWDTWIMFHDNLLATSHGIFTMNAYGAGYKSGIFDLEDVAGESSYIFTLYNGIVTTGAYIYHVQAGEYNTNQWYHLELSRNHTYINLSINGDQKEWDHVSGGITSTTDLGNMGNTTLGYDSHDTHYLDGWLDETRFSLGIQRHGSDFAVPTTAYTWNPCTTSGGTCTYGYNTTSYFHGLDCLPIELEYLFIAIGFIALITSRTIKRYGMLTAIIAPLAFGIAAWYANYICKDFVNGVNLNGNPFMLHTQIIIPVPVLSILMVVCFLIAITNILLIFFLSRPEREEGSEE